MSLEFDFEEDLVNKFINNYHKMDNEIVVKEMPIRFGNIDVVSIKNAKLPFSNEQILILSKPANALIFSKIKNKRPISKIRLVDTVGLSESTINNVLYELINCNLIAKLDNNYFRECKFVFPKTTVTGYEAKLKDFNKAFFQANNNREYVDYSYLVFPNKIANRILMTKGSLLGKNGIGLIGVDKYSNIKLLKAKKMNDMNHHIRLLSTAKGNIMMG